MGGYVICVMPAPLEVKRDLAAQCDGYGPSVVPF